MKREYKIGDLVIFIDKKASDRWKTEGGISLYGKLAQIVNINKMKYGNDYEIEFKENININGIDSEIKAKVSHYYWSKKKEFKLAINHLKFKKWIKG